MMKYKFLVLASAIATFLLPFAHAQNNAAVAMVAQATAKATAQSAPAYGPPRGALYRIHHQGKTSYLFGTIHVGTANFNPLGAEVARALEQTGKLVLELDVRNDLPLQDALRKHGLYAAGNSIDRHVAADTLQRLERSLDELGIPLADVQHMKPWLLANLLLGLHLDRSGFRRQHGAEYVLLAAAPGKTVMPLETAEYQMSLFDSMSAPLQEEYLREALIELEDGSALEKARALIDAWANADRAQLDFLWRRSLDENSRTSEFTHRVLLEQRNPAMASKVEELLKEDGGSFVGVGLLHLIGESGLPALLRQRGYAVEKVY